MNVLITGGAGFIGSHLVDDLLARGEEVVVLDSFEGLYDRAIKEDNLSAARDHAGFTLVEGDIRDAERLDALPDGIEAVVHLAARAGVRPSILEPVLSAEVNVVGTARLLELVREREITAFVLASSSSVYGNNRTVPFAEADPVERPISPYASTKRACELFCHVQAHLHGTACVCLRLFTVYGPRQRPDLAIRKFSRLLLEGRPLPRFGDGSTARDYTYIDDILQGMRGALAFARSRPGAFEIVNLGEARPIALSEMIDVLGRVFERSPVIDERPPQPGDVERTFAEISRARALFDYRPSMEFEEGMRRFADWYLEVGARQDGAG